MKRDGVAAFRHAEKRGCLATYFNGGALKPCMNAEGTARPLLAFQAMAHGDPDRLAAADQLQLTAIARCVTGHLSVGALSSE